LPAERTEEFLLSHHSDVIFMHASPCRRPRLWPLRTLPVIFIAMSEKTRRIVAVFLALSLAVGLTAHGFRASAMAVEMATGAANDMPMSGKCDGCVSDHDGMSAGACAAYCSNMTALPPVVIIALEALPTISPEPIPGPKMAGLWPPPEPYPPKPIVLI
jgi:hypothetical protein